MSSSYAREPIVGTIRRWAACTAFALIGSACGGGGGGGGGSSGGGGTTPPPATYTVGGTISGLAGTGLVIQNNGGDSLTVAANATTFQFPKALNGGAGYAVTVTTQPAGPSQTCTVTGGSGSIAAANVTGVTITCKTGTFTVGGTISGLTGSGLVLQDNGGDNLIVAAGGTAFTFATPLAGGAAYAVKVLTQPSNPTQTCTVTGGGTIGAANVTNVGITCTTSSFTVGGTISGLTSSSLVLQNNGGDNLMVNVNATGFTFAQPVPSGAPYAVTVLTQPGSPSLTCTVTGGSGSVAAGNVTGIAIACAPTTYSVGGTITGLTSNGLVLRNNAGDDLTVAGNATTFTFKTALQTGTAYAVTVATQPSGPLEHCQVSNGSGSIAAANVTGIVIDCRVVGRFLYVTNALDGVNPGNVTGFAINSADGTLTPVAGGAVATDAKPSGIVVDPSGSFAYVSNTKTSDVSRFLIDPVSGVLTPRGQFVSKSTGGTAITISPSDQYVFVGGYGPSTPTATGSLFGFSINPDSGSLTADPGSPYLADLLPQGLAVDPTSHFLFATGYQKHDVSAFAIGTPATTLLTEVASSPVNTGGNPYGVAVSPVVTADGGTIFVSDYGTGRVDVFFYDTLGNLTEAKNAPFPTGPGPKGLAVDPTGSYLYVANFDDGSVSSFSIGAKGQLTAIAATSNAVATSLLPSPGPIDVQVDPSGRYVYVVNNTEGSVALFTASAGMLTFVTTYPTGLGATAAAIN